MGILQAIITNHVLIAPFCASLISQILKFFINIIVHKKVDFKFLTTDGGMPSSHSATVMCLVVMVGFVAGFDSATFAFAFVFATVVMRDATGVRREAGKHAVSIKQLADAFNQMLTTRDEEIRTEQLKIFVGHTPLQVLMGAILGVLIGVGYIFLFLI